MSALLLCCCYRLACRVCIVAVTDWRVVSALLLLQTGVSCLHCCCYRRACRVCTAAVTDERVVSALLLLQTSASCLHCCCYRLACRVCIAAITNWRVMSALLLLQGGPGGSEARPPGATTPVAHHGTAVWLSHHHQPGPVCPASDAARH